MQLMTIDYLGYEAPPNIISLYTGDEIEKLLNQLIEDKENKIILRRNFAITG